jgi:phenylacetate-CoA oxygenase PaaH subunit
MSLLCAVFARYARKNRTQRKKKYRNTYDALRGGGMADEPSVYEVFRRDKAGAPMVHAGNVTAPSDELALIYAREVYGRRGESLALWVVPRAAVLAFDDEDMLSPAIERGYRSVEGYRMREKFQAVQERLKVLSSKF